ALDTAQAVEDMDIPGFRLHPLKGHPLTPDRKTRQLEAIRRSQLLMKSQGRLADAETCNMVRAAFGRLARVACFSTNPTNYSMWANYAKYEATNGNAIGHAGVCIEYNCDSTWSNLQLRPITYIDDVPIVDPTLQSDTAVADALYTKSREWRGEDEWRISSVIATTPPLAANFAANSKIRIEGGVSSIIFGINTPPDVISEFMGRCTLPYIKYSRVARNAVTHVRTVQPLA
ncbi:MAG: DUF2971 domain-containing protein, partial [Dokdonella sp.]